MTSQLSYGFPMVFQLNAISLTGAPLIVIGWESHRTPIPLVRWDLRHEHRGGGGKVRRFGKPGAAVCCALWSMEGIYIYNLYLYMSRSISKYMKIYEKH